jgi:hypothetical protein
MSPVRDVTYFLGLAWFEGEDLKGTDARPGWDYDRWPNTTSPRRKGLALQLLRRGLDTTVAHNATTPPRQEPEAALEGTTKAGSYFAMR